VHAQVAQRAAPRYAPAKAAHGVLLLEARGDIEVNLIADFTYKVDEFVPKTQHVNLTIVRGTRLPRRRTACYFSRRAAILRSASISYSTSVLHHVSVARESQLYLVLR